MRYAYPSRDRLMCSSLFIRLGRRALYVRYTSTSDRIDASQRTDALCHEPTFAAQQLWGLLNDLVGAHK